MFGFKSQVLKKAVDFREVCVCGGGGWREGGEGREGKGDSGSSLELRDSFKIFRSQSEFKTLVRSGI